MANTETLATFKRTRIRMLRDFCYPEDVQTEATKLIKAAESKDEVSEIMANIRRKYL